MASLIPSSIFSSGLLPVKNDIRKNDTCYFPRNFFQKFGRMGSFRTMQTSSGFKLMGCRNRNCQERLGVYSEYSNNLKLLKQIANGVRAEQRITKIFWKNCKFCVVFGSSGCLSPCPLYHNPWTWYLWSVFDHGFGQGEFSRFDKTLPCMQACSM